MAGSGSAPSGGGGKEVDGGGREVGGGEDGDVRVAGEEVEEGEDAE
jgi:hypothetical protein